MAGQLKLKKSYYNAHGVEDVCMQTSPDMLDYRAARIPEKEAYVIRDMGKPREAITYGELKSKSELLAAGMISRGLKKGDCVGVFCSTSLDYAICDYGLARAGAIMIRFHVSVKTGSDLKPQLKKGNCKWLFIHPGVGEENYKMLPNILPGIEKHNPDSGRLSVPDLPNLEAVFTISASSFPGTEPWTNLLEGNTPHDLEMQRRRQATIEVDDIQCCYATSGSTGTPKLVAHPYLFTTNALRVPYKKCGVTEGDRILTDRPMPYGGGHSGTVVTLGATMIYVKTSATVSGKEKGKEFFFHVIEEERATAFMVFPYLMPGLLQKLDAGALDTRRIKTAISAGEVIKASLYKRILKYIPNFTNVYGSTESTGVSSVPTDPVEKKITYTGTCHMGEFKVINEDGHVVPVNTPGQLCSRSPSQLRCYYGDEELTKQVLEPLGWYRTGDLASMNEDGYVTIIGRMKEVISKATIKIYPGAIENELLHHPSVEDVVAIGVPHEVLHEEIGLCVLPKKGTTLTVDNLRKFCQERFRAGEDGQGLMPDYFVIFDKFPYGATDKTDRRKVKAEAIERLTSKK